MSSLTPAPAWYLLLQCYTFLLPVLLSTPMTRVLSAKRVGPRLTSAGIRCSLNYGVTARSYWEVSTVAASSRFITRHARYMRSNTGDLLPCIHALGAFISPTYLIKPMLPEVIPLVLNEFYWLPCLHEQGKQGMHQIFYGRLFNILFIIVAVRTSVVIWGF